MRNPAEVNTVLLGCNRRWSQKRQAALNWQRKQSFDERGQFKGRGELERLIQETDVEEKS